MPERVSVSIMEKDMFLARFVQHVLDDDNGISGDAYESLVDLVNQMEPESNETIEIVCMIRRVNATDGRFYLKN